MAIFGDVENEEVESLLREIRHVFRDVSRGAGVSLHESAVIDNYGSAAERAAARAKDLDRHWWEVPDRTLEEFECSIGGLAFLDGFGFRYYVPAYMSYHLRAGDEATSLIFHLDYKDDREQRERLFDLDQRRAIAKFLVLITRRADSFDAARALLSLWGHSLPDEYIAQEFKRSLGLSGKGDRLYFWIWLSARLGRSIQPLLEVLQSSPADVLELYSSPTAAQARMLTQKKLWALPDGAHQELADWLSRSPVRELLFQNYGIQP